MLILFFSAACVSLAPETPPTALVLNVLSGESSPLLPQNPSPAADVVTGITLKAPQVGHLGSMLLLESVPPPCINNVT